MIRKTAPADIDRVMQLIDSARGIMRSIGNIAQWPEGYPKRETIAQDVALGNSYIVEREGLPIATFAFFPGPDPTYAKIYHGGWQHNEPYYVIHRIASEAGNHGTFDEMMRYCSTRAAVIRIDTHRDNLIMRHLIKKHGFSYCGIILTASGDERLAYERKTTKLVP